MVRQVLSTAQMIFSHFSLSLYKFVLHSFAPEGHDVILLELDKEEMLLKFTSTRFTFLQARLNLTLFNFFSEKKSKKHHSICSKLAVCLHCMERRV